jgi:hypothetical protein
MHCAKLCSSMDLDQDLWRVVDQYLHFCYFKGRASRMIELYMWSSVLQHIVNIFSPAQVHKIEQLWVAIWTASLFWNKLNPLSVVSSLLLHLATTAGDYVPMAAGSDPGWIEVITVGFDFSKVRVWKRKGVRYCVGMLGSLRPKEP